MNLTWQYIKDDQAGDVWNQICSTSNHSTFFHTKTWADVLNLTFRRWAPSPMTLEFGDRNLLVLPLMRRDGLLRIGYYCESMLPGVYGGPVFLRNPSEEHWRILWNEVNKFSNINLLGNPFLPHVGCPIATRRTMSTQLLDLTPGVDRILKGFRKGHYADLKAARRKGVEIRIAASMQEVDDYFNIYQDSLARWGQKASGFYPRVLFRNLFLLPKYGRSVKLWLALNQNKVIAGGWFFYHNVHAVYWHSAVHSNYMSYHPVHLLLTAAIEESARAGFRWFDFSPSGGLKGVEHFKRGFGPTRLEFSSFRRLGPMGKAFRLSRHMKQTVLRTCPL